MKNRNKFLIGALVAVLALAIIPLSAFAQQGPETPPNPVRTLMRALTETAAQTLGMTPEDFARALHEGKTPAQLATETGVPQEELTAAMQSTWNAQGEQIIAGFIKNGPPKGHRERRPARDARMWVKTSAETLEMPVKDFVQELRSGQTPAQIAEAHGSSGQALVDAIVAIEKERLDRAVAEGKVTQEKADEILADVTQTATDWVETGKAPLDKRTMNRARIAKRWTKLSAETLEMPIKDFVQGLRSGQTPAQIAEARDSSGQTLTDAITAAEKERLDRAVAEGKLTQEKADEILARVTKTATDWVENGLPGRPPRH